MEINKCLQVVAYCDPTYTAPCSCVQPPEGCKVVPGTFGQQLYCKHNTDAIKCTQVVAYCDPTYTAPCSCIPPPPGCTVVPGSFGQQLTCTPKQVPTLDGWSLALVAVAVCAVAWIVIIFSTKPFKQKAGSSK